MSFQPSDNPCASPRNAPSAASGGPPSSEAHPLLDNPDLLIRRSLPTDDFRGLLPPYRWRYESILVAVKDGSVRGILVCFTGHEVVFVDNLAVTDDAPANTGFALLAALPRFCDLAGASYVLCASNHEGLNQLIATQRPLYQETRLVSLIKVNHASNVCHA